MLITIDTTKDTAAEIRSAIGFLAHLYNLEPSDIEVPEGTTSPKENAPAAVTAAGAGVTGTVANATPPSVQTVSVPPPPSNVVPLFNVPAPPANTAAGPIASAPPAPSAAAAGVPSGVASVASQPAEYDSAGMPWDARIHQKAKGKKKDLTWKLIKGIDEATVIAVTAELAARKIATPASPSVAPAQAPSSSLNPVFVADVPPPPPAVGAVPPPPATVAQPVFLPETNNAGQPNSVPVPPVPSAPPVETVPTPNGPVTGVVPVPPIAPAGPVGVTYRSIIDKMTAGTKAQTLTAAKVLQIVQDCGCPNLQQLNQMPQIWADVDARIELALAGL